MSKDNGKLLFALLGGLAAGAALSLLFAPAKGSETRQIIADKAKDLSDTVSRKAGDIINGIKEPVRNNKSTVTPGNGTA